MKFLKKLAARATDWYAESATIVCFGDSNTQGGFECSMNADGSIDTTVDSESAYGNRLKQMLQFLYPRAQINYINSGICGDTVEGGLQRLESSVLKFSPDLTIVSFGGNDANGGLERLDIFKKSLREIFRRLQEAGSEIIFLSTDVKNTYLKPQLQDELLIGVGKMQMRVLEEGIDEAYFDAVREICAEFGVKFCDCHAKWKKMQKHGVDTTALLANYLNHPPREMHWLYAHSLMEAIFED